MTRTSPRILRTKPMFYQPSRRCGHMKPMIVYVHTICINMYNIIYIYIVYVYVYMYIYIYIYNHIYIYIYIYCTYDTYTMISNYSIYFYVYIDTCIYNCYIWYVDTLNLYLLAPASGHLGHYLPPMGAYQGSGSLPGLVKAPHGQPPNGKRAFHVFHWETEHAKIIQGTC